MDQGLQLMECLLSYVGQRIGGSREVTIIDHIVEFTHMLVESERYLYGKTTRGSSGGCGDGH
jgi:hypothetical protein